MSKPGTIIKTRNIDLVIKNNRHTRKRQGDRVLIKIALNSGKHYPATTDPCSVHSMVKLLIEKGAGKILVADQGGFGKEYSFAR